MATKTKVAEKKAETGPTCTMPDCKRPIYVRGLCKSDWNLYRPPWEDRKA